MNTPNKLTIFRILLIPVFLWALYSNWVWNTRSWNILPLVIFILAALTDWLDGHLARKRGEVTTFGKFMDPLADKLLVTAALVAFVDLGFISGIVAIIVIAREFIVTGLRLVAVGEDKVIAANFLGKLKTILQIAVIIVILILRNSVILSPVITDHALFIFAILAHWLVIIMTTITVISGIDYIWKNRNLLKAGANK